MYAFAKQDDLLLKVYDEQDDWQVLASNGREYWFSKWHKNESESLMRSINTTFIRCGKGPVTVDQIYLNLPTQ